MGCEGMTEVELTEAGETQLQKHHTQGIPYWIPHTADSKQIIRKNQSREEDVKNVS